MNSRVAFPFLTLRPQTVDVGLWMLGLEGGALTPAGDYLADWDYASQIVLQRTFSIDRQLAAADLEIDPGDLRLSLCVRVGTGAGRLPRSIISRHLISFDESMEDLTLGLAVAGHELSSILDLTTEVVIGKPPAQRSALSPSRRFDRIWQDTVRIRLEGEEPRFPIEVADLGVLLPGTNARHAPWYVHWSPGDWSRDFHGCMRLYLNKHHGSFVERVQKGEPEILRAILADVIGQVCERFLSLEHSAEDMEGFAEGSLGQQAASWIRAAWPNRDLAFVRAQLNSRPGAFRASILALAEQRGLGE